jgi:hypothetical protein
MRDRRRTRPRVAITIIALTTACALPIPTRAQVFRVEAGTSSLYHATGGTFSVQGAGLDGYVGIGDLNQFRVGALVRKEIRGGVASAGDHAVSFDLPTDIFQSPHSFYGRGIGYDRVLDDVRLRVIAGSTATAYGSPFFQSARSERGVGILFLDGAISPTVHVMTRSIFSNRQTVISGVDWRPSPGVSAGFSAGGGDGHPYAAVSGQLQRSWIVARGAWSATSNAFRRVAIPQASSSEMEGENLEVKIRPVRPVILQVGRYHFLQPQTERTEAIRGEVHQASATASVLSATASVAFYDSRTSESGNRGVSAGLTRPVSGWLDVTANYYGARERTGQTFATWVGSIREHVSPHVDLTQNMTHTSGTTTFSFGGSYLGNRFSIGAEWQTVYVPFAKDDPFQQALMITARIFAFGNFTANFGSYVAPDGSVRYTVSGNQVLYRGMEYSGEARPNFYDQMVHGIVVDERGLPVRGAAIRVDGDLVYTDSNGRFFVRKPKGRICAIEVSLKDFLTPLLYAVVSAPQTLKPQPEGWGSDAIIVVRPVIPIPTPKPRDWTGVK